MRQAIFYELRKLAMQRQAVACHGNCLQPVLSQSIQPRFVKSVSACSIRLFVPTNECYNVLANSRLPASQADFLDPVLDEERSQPDDLVVRKYRLFRRELHAIWRHTVEA